MLHLTNPCAKRKVLSLTKPKGKKYKTKSRGHYITGILDIIELCSKNSPSKSSSTFSNPFVTVPNAPITIGIIVTCMFHSFFNSLARLEYLSFFSHSFSFILWSAVSYHFFTHAINFTSIICMFIVKR